MGHGTTHVKNTSIKPQVRAIDYILGPSKDDLVALVVRVEDDSIFVHLMRWIRVLLLALLTACDTRLAADVTTQTLKRTMKVQQISAGCKGKPFRI
jgi:hypothetical protein